MTTTPEINQWQLNILTNLSSTAPTLLLTAPHDLDSKEERALREKSNKDVDQLVELGLIEDANKEGMFATYLNNIQVHLGGRTCRIFKITEMGFTMFSAIKGKVTIH